jgi:hypothetical protein
MQQSAVTHGEQAHRTQMDDQVILTVTAVAV